MEKVLTSVEIRRKLAHEYLEELAKKGNAYPDDGLTSICLTDNEKGHFQLLRMGWHEGKYHFQVLIHLEIDDKGKILVHRNATEFLIEEGFKDANIPQDNWIIAFRPPHLRRPPLSA